MIYQEWISINLTRDHKPNELDEAERILKNHGIIHPFKEDNNEFVGPQRVWTEADEVPGLAMTRSFGDQVAATVGVICIPEIKEYKVDKKTRPMVNPFLKQNFRHSMSLSLTKNTFG